MSTISDYLKWNEKPIPDFVNESQWYVKLIETDSSEPKSTQYFNQEWFDLCVSEITFPQQEINFEKTSFGLANFDKMKEYSSVTIQYYDYKNTTLGKKMPITQFFQDWINKIYNKNTFTLHNDWRTHYKEFQCTLFDAKNKWNNDTRKITVDASAIVTYNIKKCYPLKLNEISLSDSGSDRYKFSVECVCERVTSSYA